MRQTTRPLRIVSLAAVCALELKCRFAHTLVGRFEGQRVDAEFEVVVAAGGAGDDAGVAESLSERVAALVEPGPGANVEFR